jgi:hypothetical protein
VINNELIEAVIVAIANPANEFQEGAILVFLPGLMEITNLYDQLRSNRADLSVSTTHSPCLFHRSEGVIIGDVCACVRACVRACARVCVQSTGPIQDLASAFNALDAGAAGDRVGTVWIVDCRVTSSSCPLTGGGLLRLDSGYSRACLVVFGKWCSQPTLPKLL